MNNDEKFVAIIGVCCIIIALFTLYINFTNAEIQNVNVSNSTPYDDIELYKSWQYNAEHPMKPVSNYKTVNTEQTSSVSDFYFGYQYAWHPFNYWHQTGLGWNS